MKRRTVTIRSGLSLSYLERGDGQPLVMIPGWSQSAVSFNRQFDELSEVARVIAVDPRGHGESDKPDRGYRIQRLAKDLYEFLVALNIPEPDLLGHSMGCSIIWSYLSMFGDELTPRKLVLVDQAPAVVAQANWGDEERANYGCLIPDFDTLTAFEQAVLAADTVDAHKEIIRGRFTPSMGEDDLGWFAAENLKLPREQAVRLLHDHCVLDWRSEIQRIDLPTLVFGAELRTHSAQSQQWIADQIPGAEVTIFEANQGGSHFMFYENADRFNARVTAFLTS